MLKEICFLVDENIFPKTLDFVHQIGIIVLRIKSQLIDTVNAVLKVFLLSDIFKKNDYRDSLIIVDENKYRIRKR